MISKEAVLECIKAPMEQFHRDMVRHFGNWNAQVEAAEKILAGENVDHERYPTACQDEIQLMKLIMKYTTESAWDWSNPEIQKSFQDIAAGESYKIYSDTIAGIIRAIITRVPVGTAGRTWDRTRWAYQERVRRNDCKQSVNSSCSY